MGIRTGDVIFSLVRPYLKNLAIVPSDLDQQFASTAYCSLRPTAEIDGSFLFYQIGQESFIRSIPTYGTSPPSARDNEFLALEIVVPPKHEQLATVAKIEELFSGLDAGIASLERARAKLKRYRASVLKSAVEGHLTQDWRAKNTPKESGTALLKRILKTRREKWEAAQLKKFIDAGKAPPKGWKDKYPEPAKPEVTDRPTLPEDWCWATVSQLAEVGTGTTPLRTEPSYWADGDIPWVTSTAVNEDVVTLASSYVTARAMEKTTLKLYPPGTLLLAMYGEGKTRGKVSELRIAATINQALAALQFDETSAQVRDYLRVFLQSNYEQMRHLSSGGVQPNLNAGLVQRICLPFPALAEQQEIVNQAEAALSTIAHAESDIEAQLARGALLKQAILKRAFEGHLV